MTQPTDPKLWREVCGEHRAQTVEGSPAGRWSPRKAAMARLEYQRRGAEWKDTPARPLQEFLEERGK